MNLLPEEVDRIAAVLQARTASFVELVKIAGLDPKRDLIRADLHGIDFGDDDVSEFNFSRANIRHANFARARGLELATFHDAECEGTLWPPEFNERAALRSLEILVIGGVELTFGSEAVPLLGQKARAITAYLAISPGKSVSRERLESQFWSEVNDGSNSVRLEQVIQEVNFAMELVGCSKLISNQETIALQPGLCRTDLEDLLAAVATGEVPDLLLREVRLAESLLLGFEDVDPTFRGWLVAQRHMLHDRLIHSLEGTYRDMAVSRNQRRRAAEAALLLDPTHEEACRVVMRCDMADGDRYAAARAYEELEKLLRDDYGLEPSLITQNLAREIRAGGIAVPDVARSMSIPAKPAIFIESFERSGISSDQIHLVEGFRLELISCLARFREWYVTGNNRGKAEVDGRAVPISGHYVVETRSSKVDAGIDMAMELLELPSGQVIWGEEFELRLDRWLMTQQRIVRRIAATLNVELSAERLVRLSHIPQLSLEAYDIWLRSQAVIRDYTSDEWERVIKMLEGAIKRTPTFSPLYSSLAQMTNAAHILLPGIPRDRSQIQQAVALAQRAATIDPNDSRAELCLGWALAFDRRYGQAGIHMDIACGLNSNDPWTLISAGMFYAFNGDLPKARNLSAMSMEVTVSPGLSHWVYLTSIRYLLGDYEGAIVASDRAQDALCTVPAWRTVALHDMGQYEAARQEVGRFYSSVRAAWRGHDQPTDIDIGRWFLRAYPIGHPPTLARLRATLIAAGMHLPEPNTENPAYKMGGELG